jgi:hypothetical protein
VTGIPSEEVVISATTSLKLKRLHGVLEFAGVVGCLLLYGAFVRYYLNFPSTVEDSFILFRYASHLASHAGLSWNVGCPHEQGMTGVAWVSLIGTIEGFVHKDPAVIAGYAGIVVGCCTIVFLYLALRRALPVHDRYIAFVGSLALSLTPIFLRHAASGMETELTFLIFSLTVYLAVIVPTHRPLVALIWTVLLSMSSFLIRPDAPLFCLSVLVPIVFLQTSHRRVAWAVAALLSSIAMIGAEILVIAGYFTTALPLAAYIKISAVELLHNPHMLKILVPWVLSFQLDFFSTIAVWVVFVALVSIRGWKQLPERVWAGLFGALMFYLYLFTVMPVMNFDLRYQAPLIVPLIFGGTVALGSLIRTLRGSQRSGRPFIAALCLVLILYSFGDLSRMKADVRDSAKDHAAFKSLALKVGQLHGIKVASTEAGVLAYYSDAKFLDLIGLNNSIVALNHNKQGYGNLLDHYLSSSFGYPDLYVRAVGGSGPYADFCTFPSIMARYDYLGVLTQDRSTQIFILRNGSYSLQLRNLLRDTVAPSLSDENKVCKI